MLITHRRRREWPLATAPGFTLLEVMVALMIVAFSFVGLLGLHNRNLAMVARDQELTRATLLARQYITQMEVVEQFPELGRSSGNFEYYPGYAWEREVSETTLPDLREVRLRILWDERFPNGYEILYYARDHRDPDL